MGNIITREERDLLTQLRAVAGKQAEKLSDDELLAVMEAGRRQVLEKAAVMAFVYVTRTGQPKFNVFIENGKYGRVITKIHFNKAKQCIEGFVCEVMEGESAKYWQDIDQFSGPELTELCDRLELLLETLEADDDEQESA